MITGISPGASLSSGSPSGSISGSISPSGTGSPSVVPSAGGYVNQGLYNDPSSNILGPQSTSSPSMTVGVCASFCASSAYMAVENGIRLV